MPSTDQLASLRTSLEGERDQLREELTGSEASGEGITYDENFADSAQVAAEQGEHRALVSHLGDALADVERALEKLDAGTYGVCENCEQPIGEPRLEAMPATRYCIDCASRR